MNAPIRKIAAIFAMGLSSAVLGGCVGAFDPATDPSSPVATRVQALVEANRAYPRWADFPRSPEAPASPVQIAGQVNTLRIAGRALAGEAGRIDWQTDGDPEVFAAGAKARVDAVPVAPVTQETEAEIEAFLRRTRERGRAPPPVDRR